MSPSGSASSFFNSGCFAAAVLQTFEPVYAARTLDVSNWLHSCQCQWHSQVAKEPQAAGQGGEGAVHAGGGQQTIIDDFEDDIKLSLGHSRCRKSAKADAAVGGCSQYQFTGLQIACCLQ